MARSIPVQRVVCQTTNEWRGTAEAWQRSGRRLVEVEKVILERLSGVESLTPFAQYQFGTGGKRLRAQLALTACAVHEIQVEQAIPLAVACEFLHNASLVHDDIQDGDTVRRNTQTVWFRFGVPLAISFGDWLIAEAYSAVLSVPAPDARRLRLLELLARRMTDAIAGQTCEAAGSGTLASLSMASYERIAFGKTGALLSLPVEGALVLAGVERNRCDLARIAMERLGLAFQIVDDLRDLMGLKEGRAPHADLRRGAAGIAVRVYLKLAADAERSRIEQTLTSIMNGSAGTDVFDAMLIRLRKPDILAACGACYRSQRDLVRRQAHKAGLPTDAIVEPLIGAMDELVHNILEQPSSAASF